MRSPLALFGWGTSKPKSRDGLADPFPRFRKALRATQAGKSRTVIRCIGDSVTAGTGAGEQPEDIGARSGSFPSHLQALFETELKLPFAGCNFFGNANYKSITEYMNYNTQIKIGRDWQITNMRSLGAHIFCCNMKRRDAIFGFGPDPRLDSVDIYFPLYEEYASEVNVLVNGQVVGRFSERGEPSVARRTFKGVPGPDGGIGILPGEGDAGGRTMLIGMDAYSSSRKSVSVLNMGWGGSGTRSWSDKAHPTAPLNALAAAPADLTIISLGINDWQTEVDLLKYEDKLLNIVTSCKVNGGDIIIVPSNRTSTSLTPQKRQNNFAWIMSRIAQRCNVSYFDVASIDGFQDYDTAKGRGFMALNDLRHPSRLGSSFIAKGIFDLLMQGVD